MEENISEQPSWEKWEVWEVRDGWEERLSTHC